MNCSVVHVQRFRFARAGLEDQKGEMRINVWMFLPVLMYIVSSLPAVIAGTMTVPQFVRGLLMAIAECIPDGQAADRMRQAADAVQKGLTTAHVPFKS